MHIAICDDIYEEVKTIEDFLARQGDEVEYYQSGAALHDAYAAGMRYDALFLDLEMDGRTQGFTIADAVQAIDDTALVLFVTSHHQYVYECFKCSPVWFLRKPVDEVELAEAYRHTRHLLDQRRETFTFVDSHQRIRLRADEILCFESQDHDILIHTKDGTLHRFRGTMKALETQLSDSFCRVHASYIVNFQYVTRMASEDRQDLITLKGLAQKIPVSRRYKPAVSEAFLRFKEKEMMG